MKVISKFTDFYEYDAYRYGEPYPTPVWIRYDNHEFCDKNLIQDIKNKYFTRGYYTANRNKNLSAIVFHQSLVGVYPYIYYIPTISIYDIFCYWDRKLQYEIYGQDVIDCIENKGWLNELLKDKNIDYKRYILDYNVEKIIKHNKKQNFFIGHRNIFETNKFVIEDSELFNKIGDPIFYLKDNYFEPNELNFHTNICLLETPLLRSYPNIIQRDIYTDIENFLISREQEPESNPSNNTKIINAGFDLKTSFRNM